MGLFRKKQRSTQGSNVDNEGGYLASNVDDMEQTGAGTEVAKEVEELEQLRQETSLLREQNRVLQAALDESRELAESIVHEKQSIKQEYDEQLLQYREEQEKVAKEYQEKHDKRYEQLSLEKVELQTKSEQLVNENFALKEALDVQKAAARDRGKSDKIWRYLKL